MLKCVVLISILSIDVCLFQAKEDVFFPLMSLFCQCLQFLESENCKR